MHACRVRPCAVRAAAGSRESGQPTRPTTLRYVVCPSRPAQHCRPCGPRRPVRCSSAPRPQAPRPRAPAVTSARGLSAAAPQRRRDAQVLYALGREAPGRGSSFLAPHGFQPGWPAWLGHAAPARDDDTIVPVPLQRRRPGRGMRLRSGPGSRPSPCDGDGGDCVGVGRGRTRTCGRMSSRSTTWLSPPVTLEPRHPPKLRPLSVSVSPHPLSLKFSPPYPSPQNAAPSPSAGTLGNGQVHGCQAGRMLPLGSPRPESGVS